MMAFHRFDYASVAFSAVCRNRVLTSVNPGFPGIHASQEYLQARSVRRRRITSRRWTRRSVESRLEPY